jgi:hypothetical protein
MLKSCIMNWWTPQFPGIVVDRYCSFTSSTVRACMQPCRLGTEFLALKKFSTSWGWWCYNWHLSYITAPTIFQGRVVSHISLGRNSSCWYCTNFLGYAGVQRGNPAIPGSAPVPDVLRTAPQHCHVWAEDVSDKKSNRHHKSFGNIIAGWVAMVFVP